MAYPQNRILFGKEILTHSTTWRNPGKLIESSQTGKDTSCMIPLCETPRVTKLRARVAPSSGFVSCKTPYKQHSSPKSATHCHSISSIGLELEACARFLTELSAMVEMSCVCAVQCDSH